ncbi:MAG: lysine--tRNA ligase [Thermodesulfobacteriota bacterium]|nr:lysine--tRNA ligase [Thermodesulfobacteriota bacterium]
MSASIVASRLKKLDELEKIGIGSYAQDFKPDIKASCIFEKYSQMTMQELEEVDRSYYLAGRVVLLRDFGKASFFHIQDESGRIQAYIKKGQVSQEEYKIFKLLDIGDIVGIGGQPFKTKTDELTIMVKSFVLLTKSLRPLPEKWHGLRDVEMRYRQRYVDLIVNPEVREIFRRRSKIIKLIREFLDERDFLEVETPMMQPIAGGAAAKPFITYHNALNMNLYFRIAPELYLKRLVVGGFERVYELNRNFRNEGISTQHNPEFTMLEFYQSYATYKDLMEITEEMFTFIAQNFFGSLTFTHLETELDLTPPWKKMTMKEALSTYGGFSVGMLNDHEFLKNKAQELHLENVDAKTSGVLLAELFEEIVEPQLIQPTFITNYPIEISPLSKKNDANPQEVDRFELFILGREIANAFSELNDPIDQRERFIREISESCTDEHKKLDEDFIRALEYGMPPCAGEGIGIDRLVMLFTSSPSIREVILFPHLRLERET